MPENLEIKIRVPSLTPLRIALRRLRARKIGLLRQRDTYFALGHARIKLREENGKAELIAYVRPSRRGARSSRYEVLPVSKPALWKKAWLPLRVVVKTRELWRFRHTRVHLDRVRGLGTFLELETEMAGLSPAQGTSELNLILAAFHLSPHAGLAGSYSDLR